jgi:protein-L-isoaspartate(D-aspartate) O-methyltransferase
MGDEALAQQLGTRGIHDPRVLKAMASLSRRDFLPERSLGDAVGDYPLPIGHGQTISQPYIVAYMSEALRIGPGSRVLEIGTGSGYQAAVLSRMGAEVFSLEIVPELYRRARATLERLGIASLHLRLGDGARGWPEEAPFSAIILTAAPKAIPEALLNQLADEGTLLAPLGEVELAQELVRVIRRGEGFETERLLPVRFVPMTGESRGDPGGAPD